MKISLESIHGTTIHAPWRILFYGAPGVGKTTICSEFPNPIFIQTEDSAPNDVTINTFGHIREYQNIIDALSVLYKESHPYETVVIDSLTMVEEIIFQKVIQEENARNQRKNRNAKILNSINEFSHGRGYAIARPLFGRILNGLSLLRTNKNMNILYIGHSKVYKIEAATEDKNYNRVGVNLYNKFLTRLQIDLDATIYMAAVGEDIVFHCYEHQEYEAKNRYGLPRTFVYERNHGFEEFSKYLPRLTEIKEAEK